MMRGVVKWFNVKKGFGFIQSDFESKDVFVHYSDIDGLGFRYLKNGDPVEFEVAESKKGLQAQHVRRAGTEHRAPKADRECEVGTIPGDEFRRPDRK